MQLLRMLQARQLKRARREQILNMNLQLRELSLSAERNQSKVSKRQNRLQGKKEELLQRGEEGKALEIEVEQLTLEAELELIKDDLNFLGQAITQVTNREFLQTYVEGDLGDDVLEALSGFIAKAPQEVPQRFF